jgi:tetratricopeptide (TPR) repeat protein
MRSASISCCAGGPRRGRVSLPSGGNLRLALTSNIRYRKSQLAIEHCYRTAEQSLDTWVFWAHASNTARLEQSFREIADQVKIRGQKDAQADVFKLVHDWLRNEKNGRWLLVLDNADDAGVLSPPPSNSQTLPTDSCTDDSDCGGSTSTSGLQRHLSKYLPLTRHGSVLVTSRTRRAAIQIVEDSDIMLIEPMHDVAAHALLYKKLGDRVEKGDGIAELAAALEYMPLALVQAAAYIRERAPRSSVRQYLAEYRESDSRKTSLLNREAGHLRRDVAASNSVLLTWQISFDHIRSSRRSAADLLSLMSFFDRQGIQEVLLRNPSGTTDDDNFENDVLTLRDYSFITVTKETNTFEMHNLVQLATRTWLENHGQLHRWQDQFISKLCAEMPTGRHENWQKCQVLFPHARAALAQRPQNKDSLKEWALLLYKAAQYAWQRGRAGEAEHMSTVSMEVRREVCGEGSADTLSSMELIGQARERGGRWKEAELMNRQTLALKETVLGRKHPDTLTSMSNLALVLVRQGKYEEAEAMNRQTLALFKMVLGREHPSTLTTMSNLALVLDSQGKYKEAEAMNRQTLALKETVLGRKHPDTLTSMDNLAQVLGRQGKYEEAEAMNRQTLALKDTVLGREHPDTLTSMDNLAQVLGRQGKYEEAEAMNRQTLALKETVLGREHPETLVSMNNLARVLDRQGKYKEAEAMNRQTLALFETVLGREHPSTLTSMNNLALVLDSQGKYKEAEAMNRQTLALKETVLGREHPDTLTSMANLASTYRNQGQWKEAGELEVQVMETRKRVLGDEHPDTLTSVSQLESVPEKQGNYEEAESLVPVSVYQTSVGSGTYIGQNSVVPSQDDTLIGKEGRSITLKERNAEISDDSSIASHTTTGREKLGKGYIANFLADDGEMRLLCNSVLDRIDREQFVDLGRQMLKTYYLGLLEHAKTEQEKQGVRLMKSRSGRQRICKSIVDIIRGEEAGNEEEKSRAAEQNRLAEKRLEMFIKDLPDTYPYPNPNQPTGIEVGVPTDYNNVIRPDEQDEGFPDRGLESEIEGGDDDLPNLARMKEFFRESEPFQVLLNDFRVQILPHPLKDIIQTAPRGSLSLSDQHNNSLSNRMKAFVEDFTMLEWNWWPLEPRMRSLTSCETRLFWCCVSSNTIQET